MKTIIFGIVIMSTGIAACNSNNNTSDKTNVKSIDTTHTNIQAKNTMEKQPAALREVLSGYLQLKNALVNDNGNEAANAGKEMTVSLGKLDESTFSTTQKKAYTDVKDDLKENAEHISANANKVAHQREHFEMLSKDMYDLVKTFPGNQALYKEYCPMYNNGKGAFWLSEMKEIKNPYLGKKMPSCGEVQEEIK